MMRIKVVLVNKEEAPSFFAHVGRQVKLGYRRGVWEDGSMWKILEGKEGSERIK